MSATVRYRYFPTNRMRYGPICIHITPTGDVRVAVDETAVDPLIGPVISGMFNSSVQTDLGIELAPMPSPEPLWNVRVHRDHALGGDQLVEVEVVGPDMNIFMPHELIKSCAAVELGRHSTQATRLYVAKPSPEDGEVWTTKRTRER